MGKSFYRPTPLDPWKLELGAKKKEPTVNCVRRRDLRGPIKPNAVGCTREMMTMAVGTTPDGNGGGAGSWELGA